MQTDNRQILNALSATANADADKMNLVMGNGLVDPDAMDDAYTAFQMAEAAKAVLLRAVEKIGGDTEAADNYLHDLFGDCIDPQREAFNVMEAA